MTSKCIQHTCFQLHAQLAKDSRQVRQVSKVAWAPLLARFLEEQRTLSFAEYLRDPVCHCFDAEGGAVETDVDLVADSSNPVDLDDGVDWASDSSNLVELDDVVSNSLTHPNKSRVTISIKVRCKKYRPSFAFHR